MWKGTSVLVVDHDEDDRDYLEALLRGLGAYAVTAASAAEAMTALRLSRIDAAIVDARLPDATGDMLLGRMCRAGHRVPAIVLVSPRARREGGLHGSAGFDGFLAKPVDMALLEESLRRVLAPRRPAGGARVARAAPSRSGDVRSQGT